MKRTFFANWPVFLLWPRVFSGALGCGARKRPACTALTVQDGVPAMLRDACSRRSKSRAKQFLNRGAWEKKKRNSQGLRRHFCYGSLKVIEICAFFCPKHA